MTALDATPSGIDLLAIPSAPLSSAEVASAQPGRPPVLITTPRCAFAPRSPQLVPARMRC
jgi:hypothetical protein